MKKKTRKKDNQRKKVVNQIKQSIALLLIAILIFYIMSTIYNLLKRPADVLILENGTLSLEEEAEGLIIREEYVVQGESYNQNGMLQIKTEGERVAKNEPIFRYYSQSEDSIKEKIKEAEAKIQESMLNMDENEILSSDIPLIEAQIKEKSEELYKVSDLQKIHEIKRDINTYMSKKIEIIGETVDKNSEIKQWITKRQEYENELVKNSGYVNATESGVVSYRVDNFEELLKTDDFSYVNKELIDSINSKVGEIIATSEDKGKIINNFESYIAVNLSSNEAKMTKIGKSVKIQLSNIEKIGATVEAIKVESDDSRTITFKITQKIEELIKYRKIPITIVWWEENGFKLPNLSIKIEDNEAYVMRNRNGYKDKILVKVVQQNENYSIIENYTNDELEKLGYTKEEINKMGKLALYDEILIDSGEILNEN